MYRKPHHKFLQNFLVMDISQVAMCVSSQISERVTGEGSFAKGFAMSSDSQNAIKKIKNLLDQMEAINPLNHYYNLFCLGRLSEKAAVALLLPFLACVVTAAVGVASRIRFSVALLLLACVFHNSAGLSLFFPHHRLSILS
jgi:hypothetical protein